MICKSKMSFQDTQDFRDVVLRNPNAASKNKSKSSHFQGSKIKNIENETDCNKPDIIGKNTGLLIQQARIAKGYKSQKDFANSINMPVQDYNGIERGIVCRTSINNNFLQKIRRTLNVKI